MMIYPSYIIANLIGSGRTMSRGYNNSKTPIVQILWLSFLSAVNMTAWDLVVDPNLSGPTEKAWIWEDGGGQHFGVPLHNFGGWILTTFTIYFLFRVLSERMLQALPSRPLTTSIILLPLIAYGAMMVAIIIPGEPQELRITGPIVMGSL